MNNFQYDYAVIGGDLRQVHLAEELSRHQNRIIYHALMRTPEKCSDSSILTKASCPKEAVRSSRNIICPIPLSKDGTHLNQNCPEPKLLLNSLLNILKSGQTFYAGCIPDTFLKPAKEKGILVHDLMKNNALAIYNTIATAEGAICEAIQKSPQNLHQSHCAVLGYGRCGRTLTNYLKGMFCHIYVCSNQNDECSIAQTIAERTGSLCDFADCAGEFDFIFNTIPAKVLTPEILKKTKLSVTIIDIASAPGGVDYEEARRLNRNAFLCLGLPGKYSPYSCAKAIMKIIKQNQNEIS